MSKSAVMVFSKDAVNGYWKWGEYSLPIVSSYSYLAGPAQAGGPSRPWPTQYLYPLYFCRVSNRYMEPCKYKRCTCFSNVELIDV